MVQIPPILFIQTKAGLEQSTNFRWWDFKNKRASRFVGRT